MKLHEIHKFIQGTENILPSLRYKPSEESFAPGGKLDMNYEQDQHLFREACLAGMHQLVRETILENKALLEAESEDARLWVDDKATLQHLVNLLTQIERVILDNIALYNSTCDCANKKEGP